LPAVDSAAQIWRTTVDGPLALQAAPIARRPSSSRDSAGASARMVFSTQEHVAHLVAAGSSPFLRIWNIQNETCIGVLPTGSDASSVTCLASSSNGNLLAAGFGNGFVHLYDCRQRYSQICALMKHTSSVLNESALHLPHCSLSRVPSVPNSLPQYTPDLPLHPLCGLPVALCRPRSSLPRRWQQRQQAARIHRASSLVSGCVVSLPRSFQHSMHDVPCSALARCTSRGTRLSRTRLLAPRHRQTRRLT
jgi:hypothetical protein